ncbi:MAG: type secretion protein [Gammaproteobacteria bacterium]|nr:type secretion protein [Gammaproteobacteria bacterium]
MKLFTARWFLVLIAIALLSLTIWYGGPYLALGTYKPFEDVVGRLVGILALVVIWTLWVQVRQAKAQRAGKQLAQDVSGQRGAVKSGTRDAAPGGEDASKLRAGFEEAVASLQGSKRGGVNLYHLPWYIIIGPPGAGKTTIIINSGLNFPLSERFGKKLRGVGGTRNCDWWFTDEAVLLDTAGRYTTQDSDAAADSAGWLEFLHLLRKHRSRRPINGVILAMSASDLVALSESDRHRHVEAIRRRLEELTRELRISLPVYFVLTKVDLIAGFSEFFDDLTQEGRAQVWGVTLPLPLSRSGGAAAQVGDELDTLIERLGARSLLRLEAERDLNRRARIFAFPSQLAALKGPLAALIAEVFEGSNPSRGVLLRGVYFTSGTQEGTPIDRIMGALARNFGLNVRGAAAPTGQGRAYFIQRFLKQVLFPESGLAGVNRRLEVRQAVTQAFIYIGIAMLAALGFIVFSVSYERNHAYLLEVAKAAEPLRSVSSGEQGDPLTRSLDKLDALSAVVSTAAEYQGNVSFTMRWGLYQGSSMTNAARDAYILALNADLLPAVADHFRARLPSLAREPDKLYEYLKIYLMLGNPEHLDPNQVKFVADLEWQRQFAADPATRERVAGHFNALIAQPDRVQKVSLDQDTVDAARNSLRQASLPVLMYSRLKLAYAGDSQHTLDVAKEIGLGSTSLFVRRSGVSLSQPFPALYTKPVFDEISTTGRFQLLKQFVSEDWVLGGGLTDAAKSPQNMSQMMSLYETDYIRAWDELLGDLALRRAKGAQESADQWGLLAAPTSPLKRLLVLVEANTNLLKAPAQTDVKTQARSAIAGGLDTLGALLGGNAPQAEKPGTTVTRHFEPLHKLVAGNPAPIDLTLAKFANVQQTMAQINALGGPPPLELANKLSMALKDLETHAKTLPGPMDAVITRTTGEGAAVVRADIGNDFASRYSQQVVSECRDLASGRYPVMLSSGVDLPLADFGRLFGPAGVFESFFKGTMANFVDTNQAAWAWKPEAASIGGSRAIPAQFQQAERIKQTYFAASAPVPEVRFTLTPLYLDSAVTRMVIEMDGQMLEYRHGPQRPVPMVWPGPSPGQAALTFEMQSGASPNIVVQGPWALFRLIQKGTVQPQSDTSFIVTFTLEGSTARVGLLASSSRNPFGRNILQGFACHN